MQHDGYNYGEGEDSAYVKRDVKEEERVRKLGHRPYMLFNT